MNRRGDCLRRFFREVVPKYDQLKYDPNYFYSRLRKLTYADIVRAATDAADALGDEPEAAVTCPPLLGRS